MVFLGEPMPTNKPIIIPSLLTDSDKDITLNNKKYIVLKEQLEQVQIHFIEKQNNYLINEVNSPVIEFLPSLLKKSQNSRKPGRFFFITECYDKPSQAKKEEQFVKLANSLFKKIKKDFRYKTLPNHSDVIIS